MALARPGISYTEEEYLRLEEEADYKSEYYRGQIYALAGASANHNRISRNVLVVLSTGLRHSPCEAFPSDMRLWIEAHGLYTYPDAMVVCGEIEFRKDRNDTLTNPTLIVEVLSPTTADYDRTQKFTFYQAIPSLSDYVLIRQDLIYVEHFHRQDDGRWLLTVCDDLDQILTVETIGVDLPLRRLYERVDWVGEATRR